MAFVTLGKPVSYEVMLFYVPKALSNKTPTTDPFITQFLGLISQLVEELAGQTGTEKAPNNGQISWNL